MKSNNPIFSRSEQFNGRAAAPGYSGYGDPTAYGAGDQQVDQHVDQGRMTIDSVVQKTAISLFVVIATAALTWWWTGDSITENSFGEQVQNDDAIGRLYLALMVGSFGAFALSIVNSMKRIVSPPLVIGFAVLEGVALGAFSKIIPLYTGVGNGVIVQAVIGTFAAFAGTLAAYKFFDIQVGNKFRTFVFGAMLGMVALGMMEMMLSFFGNAVGFFGFGGLGLVFAIGGLVLGVFMLILDFDFVEQGIAAGAPERESWRAAFALTVSLVWIYTNLLRILAILQSD